MSQKLTIDIFCITCLLKIMFVVFYSKSISLFSSSYFDAIIGAGDLGQIYTLKNVKEMCRSKMEKDVYQSDAGMCFSNGTNQKLYL